MSSAPTANFFVRSGKPVDDIKVRGRFAATNRSSIHRKDALKEVKFRAAGTLGCAARCAMLGDNGVQPARTIADTIIETKVCFICVAQSN